MNVNDFTPCMEGHHQRFVSSERQCKHIGLNPSGRCYIRQFHVDGGIFTEKDGIEKCDYLLLNDTDLKSYYIELKGSDIAKAISQIDETVKRLAPTLKEYDIFRRIIYRTGSHGIHENAVLRWKVKHRGKVVIQSVQFEEII